MQKLLLVVGLCVLVAHLEATGSRKLVCTFQRDFNFDMATDMDPLLCTHIIFKSVQPDPATMTIPSSGGPIQDHLEFNGATTKTLLEVDLIGISSAIFAPSNRAIFIASVIAVVDDENCDGVNIVWMKCESSKPADKTGFTLLMQDLKLELVGRLLTASVSGVPSVIDNSYEVAELAEVVDFFNVMTADLDRKSPVGTFPNAIAGMRHLVAEGAPKAKLNMGIATYGVDTKPGATPSILPKPQVCDVPLPPTTLRVDSDATIDAKAQHIVDEQFGGAFVTSLQLDDFNGVACAAGPYPVIQRVKGVICP